MLGVMPVDEVQQGQGVADGGVVVVNDLAVTDGARQFVQEHSAIKAPGVALWGVRAIGGDKGHRQLGGGVGVTENEEAFMRLFACRNEPAEAIFPWVRCEGVIALGDAVSDEVSGDGGEGVIAGGHVSVQVAVCQKGRSARGSSGGGGGK